MTIQIEIDDRTRDSFVSYYESDSNVIKNKELFVREKIISFIKDSVKAFEISNAVVSKRDEISNKVDLEVIIT